MRPDRIEILGVPVDVVDEASCILTVDRSIARGESCSIVAINPEKVMRARKDGVFLQALRGSTLLIPDGIGVVAVARLLARARMKRLAGSDLMPQLCAHAARHGYPVFLFGASQDVNRRVTNILLERYPSLQIAGQHHGYASDDEMPTIVEDIRQSGAQILFLALGSPKQEFWLNRYFPATKVPVCQCVGGTFDVLAGHVRRAPALWQRLGLEWAYRLVRQPSRVGRQRVLLTFMLEALRAWLLGLYRHVAG